jgi:hypothetical protein
LPVTILKQYRNSTLVNEIARTEVFLVGLHVAIINAFTQQRYIAAGRLIVHMSHRDGRAHKPHELVGDLRIGNNAGAGPVNLRDQLLGTWQPVMTTHRIGTAPPFAESPFQDRPSKSSGQLTPLEPIKAVSN